MIWLHIIAFFCGVYLIWKGSNEFTGEVPKDWDMMPGFYAFTRGCVVILGATLVVTNMIALGSA